MWSAAGLEIPSTNGQAGVSIFSIFFIYPCGQEEAFWSGEDQSFIHIEGTIFFLKLTSFSKKPIGDPDGIQLIHQIQ